MNQKGGVFLWSSPQTEAKTQINKIKKKKSSCKNWLKMNQKSNRAEQILQLNVVYEAKNTYIRRRVQKFETPIKESVLK